jgi:aryl-alcohol dehydrogenase-like predicted oxidoreductase
VGSLRSAAVPIPDRTVPATGTPISVLGLGAWAMGGTGWSGQDDERSMAAIRRAAERGVGWIDTAAIYGQGHAEEVVGRAVRALPEDERPLLFTKCGLRLEEASGRVERVGDPAFLRADCEASLRRLGVERIDLLQIHWPPEDGTPIEDAWAAMDGLVRWIGVSNFGVELLERCAAVRRVDMVQPPLSLVAREALGDIIPWAREHGAGVIVYSPLQSGLLAGRFSEERVRALPPEDWRPRRPEFQQPALGRTLALVERLRPLAERHGCSMAELAIAWALHADGVTGAIVGGRDAAQIDGWVGAAEVHLDPEDLDEIARAIEETGAGEGPVRRYGDPAR